MSTSHYVSGGRYSGSRLGSESNLLDIDSNFSSMIYFFSAPGVSVRSSSRSNLPVGPAPALSTLHIAPCVRCVLWISVSHVVVLDYSVAEISESHQPLWPPFTFTPFAECSVERQKHPKSPLFSTFRWFPCGVPVNSDAFDANRLSKCSR